MIIIHRGKILASDTPANLMKTLHAGGMINVEVRGPREEIQAKLRDVEGVASVAAEPGDDDYVRCAVEPKPGVDPREKIFQTVVASGWTLRELNRARTSLEDIFVHITHEEDEAEEDRREQRRSVLR